ncbi:hypothetical protein D3C76_1258090 [compost metagenome]
MRRTQQPGLDEIRPTALDRADDDDLGHAVDLPAVRHHADRVLYPAPVYRCRRSRVLSGRGAVSLAVVPDLPPWPHHGVVHVGDPGIRPARQPLLRLDSQPLRRGPGRSRRLAVDVPAARHSDGDPRCAGLFPAQ